MVEGPELLNVAWKAGAPIESVFVSPSGRSSAEVAGLVDGLFGTGVRVFDLAPGVLERVADTVSPQPVLAVVGFEPPALEVVREASMVLVCAEVRDPGNAGTIIRTADAAGADAVICCEGTVDPTNPKTVRASAGSLFHLPVVAGGEVDGVIEQLRSWRFVVVGTTVGEGVDYVAQDWNQRFALVLGNESSGLDEATLDAVDERVTVPMAGRAESLNVSISAAVISFEALRQRRLAGEGKRWTAESGVPGSTISEMRSRSGQRAVDPDRHPEDSPHE